MNSYFYILFLTHKNIDNQTKYQDSNFGKINISQCNTTIEYRGKTTGIALKYVIEGKECYDINTNQLDVHKGQFIILREDVNYTMFAKNMFTGGFCLDINPELLNIRLSDFLDNDLLFNQPFSGILSTQLGRSLHDFSNTFPVYDFKKDSINLINGFKGDLLNFHEEMRIIRDAVQRITKKTDTQKSLISKLFKAREYIHSYYAHKIT